MSLIERKTRKRMEREMKKHDYKGWVIELIPEADGIMWWCRYVISKTAESTMQWSVQRAPQE
jgi:hypothetical protein